MTPAPKRRWFRFSLRTLFVVVTVFGCWLGWEWRVSHERNDVRAWVESGGGSLIHSDRYRMNLFDDWKEAQVVLPSSKFSKDDEDNVRQAFPESTIYDPSPLDPLPSTK